MSAKIKSYPATEAHKRVADALLAVMQTEGAALREYELLAIAAHLVGQLIAMQDQRTMTPAQAMALVSSNLEAGNAEMLEQLQAISAGSA